MKLLVGTALLAFSFTAGHPWPALLLLLLASGASLAGPRLEIPGRPLALGLAVGATLSLALVGEPPAGHRFGPEARTAYASGLALGGMLVTLLLRRGPAQQELVAVGLALLLTLVAGSTQDVFPFALFTGLQMLWLAAFLRGRLPGGRSRRASILALGALLLAGLLGGTLAYALRFSEVAFNQLLAASVGSLFSTSAAFAPQTSLSAIRAMQTGRAVVVRVVGDAPAAHLAGRRYLTYREQSWHVEAAVSLAPRKGEFYLLVGDAAVDPGVRERVELNPAGLETLFTPLDAVGVAPGLAELNRDTLGVAYLPSTAAFSGTYQVARGQPRWPEPGPEARALPVGLEPIIARLAREQAGTGGPREQAMALQAFLQDGFEYGFGYPFAKDRDPVAQFLEKRPPAHCELFASAMVLMLRAQGIASRYVTGFLVRERHPAGGYWVARVKDAHAWVEAWIPGTGWMTFDPTPPSALPSESMGAWEARWDEVLRRWSQFKGMLASGELARWGMLLLVVLLLWLGRRSLVPRWRARTRPPPPLAVDPGVARMRALLAELERRLGPRPRSSSLAEWAGQVPQGAEFLSLYERIRYREDRPSTEHLEALRQALERVSSPSSR